MCVPKPLLTARLRVLLCIHAYFIFVAWINYVSTSKKNNAPKLCPHIHTHKIQVVFREPMATTNKEKRAFSNHTHTYSHRHDIDRTREREKNCYPEDSSKHKRERENDHSESHTPFHPSIFSRLYHIFFGRRKKIYVVCKHGSSCWFFHPNFFLPFFYFFLYGTFLKCSCLCVLILPLEKKNGGADRLYFYLPDAIMITGEDRSE